MLPFPLKQLVKAPTRGLSILDNIYINIQNYYNKPSVIPCVGRSDLNAVSFVPISNHHSHSGHSYLHTRQKQKCYWPTIFSQPYEVL